MVSCAGPMLRQDLKTWSPLCFDQRLPIFAALGFFLAICVTTMNSLAAHDLTVRIEEDAYGGAAPGPFPCSRAESVALPRDYGQLRRHCSFAVAPGSSPRPSRFPPSPHSTGALAAFSFLPRSSS